MVTSFENTKGYILIYRQENFDNYVPRPPFQNNSKQYQEINLGGEAGFHDRYCNP